MADDNFRLPASSYDEIVKIILGYGSHGRAATIKDISRTIAINRTSISANNAFLMSIGLIEQAQENKKVITEEGKSLSLSLQIRSDEQISLEWMKIVKNNDFLQKILAAIRIRQGMDRNTLITHILYTAVARRTNKTVAGCKALIEIFKIAKLIVEKDDKIIPLKEDFYFGDAEIKKAGQDIGKDFASSDIKLPINQAICRSLNPNNENSGVNFQFKFNITCSLKEFIELIPELKHALIEISEYLSIEEEVAE